MEEVSRQEKKFLISVEEFIRCSHQLEQVLIQDKHNGTDGYRIRSLYFDTLDNKDFVEKEEGIETRKKIRLRLYDPSGDFAMLEMKQKQGMYQKKRSLRMEREDAIELTKGNYSVLLKYDSPFAAECFGVMNCGCYIPRTIVEYKRKAFIAKENRIRITFDHNIEATESCFHLFDEHLNMYPVWDRVLTVLEVKYNGFLLSYIRELINQISRSELSVSKYCLARSVSMRYVF